MPWLKIVPLEKKVTKAKLQGVPDKIELIDGDPCFLNTDFLAMVSPADRVNSQVKIPENCSVLVLHDGSHVPVRGSPDDLARRIKVAENKKEK